MNAEPTIGLIHGWAMHGGLFDDLCRAWPEPDWRLLDLPGHGHRRDRAWPEDSDELLDEVLDGLPEGAWLAGWSLGGLVAMQAALRAPDRFAGLVLIAATPSLVRRPHWPNAVEPAMLQAMALELAEHPDAVIQRFLTLEMHGAVHATSDLKRLRALAFAHGRPSRAALLAGLKHLADTDLTGRLEALDLPVALIGGRRDKLVPWAALEAMAERLPRAETIRIPGAAHAPFLTDPSAVASAMRRWIHAHA
ncbi:alpha/beta fold hydrolase [Wenzhouxiangella sp. XN79A]|uniref:alpha/beta fold hydrolase n=1 Tax=Wenzhouxiangella sp. XN79A TaxID=2724193 RepID=UPI00144A6963|nr:alpha/beta fold hydrolase [Wenzhouxiangella sp. XN79A]NKI35268.1 alpha/beta fold hydrolase [Wenzhouxiangella sp. XN79A]